MFQQTQFLDIVFLVVIAVFLFARLKSVLGTRPEERESAEKHCADSLKVVDISEYRTLDNSLNETEEKFEKNTSEVVETQESNITEVFEKIKKIDNQFTVKGFLDKATRAFEYIAKAFAAGDKEDLRPLLSKELYDKFVKVIKERQERRETVEFALIGFDSVNVVKAELFGTIAELTVEFVTDQTSIVKNEKGEIIDGDPTYIETVADVWTLRKDVKSAGPVWVLTATKQKSR